jgi:hypothetical protein
MEPLVLASQALGCDLTVNLGLQSTDLDRKGTQKPRRTCIFLWLAWMRASRCRSYSLSGDVVGIVTDDQNGLSADVQKMEK